MPQQECDFLMEKRLLALDPDLHRTFTNSVFAMQRMLSNYQKLFPTFTDHTELHSLSVIHFCNLLIGTEQIEKLNADEIYILLMSCYLHDAGMGVSEKDYKLFSSQLEAAGRFSCKPGTPSTSAIRDHHHELSGQFVKKYAELFEIPSPEHVFCIVQVSRGHRRTDLFDPEEYPAAYQLPNGNTVCLPYLAALIRLADEIDVTADRNPLLLYDIADITSEREAFFHRLQLAVRSMDTTPEGFMMHLSTNEGGMIAAVETMRDKMQATLDLCKAAVHLRTPFRITQQWVAFQQK